MSGGFGWMDILLSFMGVEVYEEINLVSIKSIYVISNIPKKEMVYCGYHLVFSDWKMGMQKLFSKMFFSHGNETYKYWD